MKVEMHEVESSNISAVGFDEFSSTLVVKFNKGVVYSYLGVNNHLFLELVGADSVGMVFAKSVKGSFSCKRHSVFTEEENTIELV